MPVLVTIGAAATCDWRRKVRCLVAGRTFEVRVLSEERVSGPEMVETRRQRCLANLPSRCRVASFAFGAERGPVGIAVTSAAFRKIDAPVLDRTRGLPRFMALPAGDSRVQPRQREPCQFVVESRNGLPRVVRVAGCTARTQLPTVRIAMAGKTIGAEAEESLIQIF